MTISQREAVYTATTEVIGNSDLEFNGDVKPIAKQIRPQVCQLVMAMFVNGTAEFKDTPENKAKLADPKELKKYVDGLITNWFNKDTRLNGDVKYAAKNPGSRAGQGDAVLKNLKMLAIKVKDQPEALAKVEAAIAERTAAIKPTVSVEIDVDLLPEELRDLISA